MKVGKITQLTAGKSLGEFEQTFGAPKLKRLERELGIEREKVDALAGTKDRVHVLPITDKNAIRFAVIGDTQIGNLYACPENLAAFYAAAKERGCEVVLHTGDVLDGWKVYKGQEFELRDVGFEAQLARFKNEMPRGIPVKFITGNHDASFKNLAGISVGGAIEKARPDWQFVGEDQGVVELKTKSGFSFTVGLYHMGGGTAYAVSYRPQKAVEQMEGGRKPNMAAFGHFHKAEFMPSYRNVCIIQSGCFEWQTPFMQRLPTAAHVGGWIIEVMPGKNYNRINAEFIAFYRERS
jgi:hypothetical protein